METMRDVFIKHNMTAVNALDPEKSIFGVNHEGKMLLSHNILKTAYFCRYGLFEELVIEPEPVNFSLFAEDMIKAMNTVGFKNITGDYKVYIDDGNKLIIEGGKIELH